MKNKASTFRRTYGRISLHYFIRRVLLKQNAKHINHKEKNHIFDNIKILILFSKSYQTQSKQKKSSGL